MHRRHRSPVPIHCISTVVGDGAGLLRFVPALFRSRAALLAENLFLRKQLAFYLERDLEPRRLTDTARICLVAWSRLFNWREALVIVKPETLIGWHRQGFRLFWKWKSKGGRPRLPSNIRQLIAEMAGENPTWGEERIANELGLKLGIHVSPRTVRAYWPEEPSRSGPRSTHSQDWSTFLRNHARAIVACDFLVAVTARFQLLYVLVVMEIGSRRLLHCNVTAHPSAFWTMQQFREAIPSEHRYRFLIHDRDPIFSSDFDDQVDTLGVRALRTPVRALTGESAAPPSIIFRCFCQWYSTVRSIPSSFANSLTFSHFFMRSIAMSLNARGYLFTRFFLPTHSLFPVDPKPKN